MQMRAPVSEPFYDRGNIASNPSAGLCVRYIGTYIHLYIHLHLRYGALPGQAGGYKPVEDYDDVMEDLPTGSLMAVCMHARVCVCMYSKNVICFVNV